MLFPCSSDIKFAITLNNKDSLTGDEETLASFGIVSGDLICLILEDTETELRVFPTLTSSLQPQQNNHEPSTSAICHNQSKILDSERHNGHLPDDKVQDDIQMNTDNMVSP